MGPDDVSGEQARESLLAVDVVVAEARRYRVWRMQRADLHQAGMVGLLVAADRFDPDRGVPFRAFARHWVRKEIQRAIADQEFASTVPAALTGSLVALRGLLATDRADLYLAAAALNMRPATAAAPQQLPTSADPDGAIDVIDTSAPRWSESIGCHKVARRTRTLGAGPLEDEVRRA